MLHKPFEIVKIKDVVLEVKIIDDQTASVYKLNFHRAIGVTKNRQSFKLKEPTYDEFQSFLTQIGYNREFKAKVFKKSVVPGL